LTPADSQSKMYDMKEVSVIIVAAGESKRLKTKTRKPYLVLKGKAILRYSLDVFRKIPAVGEIIIAINPKDSEKAGKVIRPINHKPVQIKTVIGGAVRSESVLNALKATSSRSRIILIHDAARPFIRPSDIIVLIKEISRTGAAILATPVIDTIKKTRTQKNHIIIEETITPRRALWAAQTPQGFKRDILIKAYNSYKKSSGEITDDASLVERLGLPVSIVKGSVENIKITTKADIRS
jgi:2-C-methyl-D-erythritol 4-phosphate cytidylyltransferase